MPGSKKLPARPMARSRLKNPKRKHPRNKFSTTSSSAQKFTNTWPSGLQATETDTQQLGQASESMVLPDGTSTTTTNGPDPRWGIQVPFGTSQTVTLGN